MWLLDRSNTEKENNFSLGFPDLKTSTQHWGSPPRVWAAPTRCAPPGTLLTVLLRHFTLWKWSVFLCGHSLLGLSSSTSRETSLTVSAMECVHAASQSLRPASHGGFLRRDFLGVWVPDGHCWDRRGSRGPAEWGDFPRSHHYVTELASSPGLSITWAPGAQSTCALKWLLCVHFVSKQSRVVSGRQKVVPLQLGKFSVPRFIGEQKYEPLSERGVCVQRAACSSESAVKWKMRLMFQIIQFPNYALIIHIKQVKWPLTET